MKVKALPGYYEASVVATIAMYWGKPLCALYVYVAGYPTTKEKVRVRQSTGRTEGMS